MLNEGKDVSSHQVKKDKKDTEGEKHEQSRGEQPDQEAAPSIPSKSGQRAHVLLVEDNPVNQKVLARYLKKVGIDAEIAADGVECTDKVFSHPPNHYSHILVSTHKIHPAASSSQVEKTNRPVPPRSVTCTCPGKMDTRHAERSVSGRMTGSTPRCPS